MQPVFTDGLFCVIEIQPFLMEMQPRLDDIQPDFASEMQPAVEFSSVHLLQLLFFAIVLIKLFITYSIVFNYLLRLISAAVLKGRPF